MTSSMASRIAQTSIASTATTNKDKGKQMLSENLTQDNLKNLTVRADDLVIMFTNLEKKGYEEMNLKLVIDLIGTQTFREELAEELA